MDERKKLLAAIQASQFAAWELHMYLDTHPCDSAASEMHKKYMREASALKKRYEEKYGPLTTENSEEADWLSDPWPWDYQGRVH